MVKKYERQQERQEGRKGGREEGRKGGRNKHADTQTHADTHTHTDAQKIQLGRHGKHRSESLSLPLRSSGFPRQDLALGKGRLQHECLSHLLLCISASFFCCFGSQKKHKKQSIAAHTFAGEGKHADGLSAGSIAKGSLRHSGGHPSQTQKTKTQTKTQTKNKKHNKQ